MIKTCVSCALDSNTDYAGQTLTFSPEHLVNKSIPFLFSLLNVDFYASVRLFLYMNVGQCRLESLERKYWFCSTTTWFLQIKILSSCVLYRFEHGNNSRQQTPMWVQKCWSWSLKNSKAYRYKAMAAKEKITRCVCWAGFILVEWQCPPCIRIILPYEYFMNCAWPYRPAINSKTMSLLNHPDHVIPKVLLSGN